MPHVNLVEEFFAMMAMLALTELQSSTSSYTSEPLLDIISAAIHRIHGRELREMSQNNLLERTHSTINLILARRHGYLFFNAASATRPTTSATNTASRSSSSSFGLSQLFVRGRTASTRPGTATREGTSSTRDRSRLRLSGPGLIVPRPQHLVEDVKSADEARLQPHPVLHHDHFPRSSRLRWMMYQPMIPPSFCQTALSKTESQR